MKAASGSVVSALEQVQNRLDSLTDERGRLAEALKGEKADAVREAIGEILNWATTASGLCS